MNFTVRPARAEDIPQMCDLLAELFRIEADFSPGRERQKRGLSMLIKDRSGSSFLAVAVSGRGGVIGMCSAQIVISTAEGGPAGLVEDLIVRPDCRGSGIGTALLDTILKWARAGDINRLQLLVDKNNKNAFAFYSPRGWRLTDLVCLRKML